MLSKEYKEALLEVLSNIPPKKVDWRGCSQIWRGLLCLGFGLFVTVLRIALVCTLPLSIPLLTYITVINKRDRERYIKELRENYHKPIWRVKK